MKIGVLRSIGHNIADSLASGLGFPIGVYDTDVFGEASASAEGAILVDFLNGSIVGDNGSSSLREAVALYQNALISLCEKQGADISAFSVLRVRYSNLGTIPRFVVEVESSSGLRAVDEYQGPSGKRVKASQGSDWLPNVD